MLAAKARKARVFLNKAQAAQKKDNKKASMEYMRTYMNTVFDVAAAALDESVIMPLVESFDARLLRPIAVNNMEDVPVAFDLISDSIDAFEERARGEAPQVLPQLHKMRAALEAASAALDDGRNKDAATSLWNLIENLRAFKQKLRSLGHTVVEAVVNPASFADVNDYANRLAKQIASNPNAAMMSLFKARKPSKQFPGYYPRQVKRGRENRSVMGTEFIEDLPATDDPMIDTMDWRGFQDSHVPVDTVRQFTNMPDNPDQNNEMIRVLRAHTGFTRYPEMFDDAPQCENASLAEEGDPLFIKFPDAKTGRAFLDAHDSKVEVVLPASRGYVKIITTNDLDRSKKKLSAAATAEGYSVEEALAPIHYEARWCPQCYAEGKEICRCWFNEAPQREVRHLTARELRAAANESLDEALYAIPLSKYPKVKAPPKDGYSDWYDKPIKPDQWGVQGFQVKPVGRSEVQITLPQGADKALRKSLADTLDTPADQSPSNMMWLTDHSIKQRLLNGAYVIRSWVTMKRNPKSAEMKRLWKQYYGKKWAESMDEAIGPLNMAGQRKVTFKADWGAKLRGTTVSFPGFKDFTFVLVPPHGSVAKNTKGGWGVYEYTTGAKVWVNTFLKQHPEADTAKIAVDTAMKYLKIIGAKRLGDSVARLKTINESLDEATKPVPGFAPVSRKVFLKEMSDWAGGAEVRKLRDGAHLHCYVFEGDQVAAYTIGDPGAHDSEHYIFSRYLPQSLEEAFVAMYHLKVPYSLTEIFLSHGGPPRIVAPGKPRTARERVAPLIFPGEELTTIPRKRRRPKAADPLGSFLERNVSPTGALRSAMPPLKRKKVTRADALKSDFKAMELNAESLPGMFVEQPPNNGDDNGNGEKPKPTTKDAKKAEKEDFDIDDIQLFYDMQIAGSATRKEAEIATRRQFKIKTLKVNPAGRIAVKGMEKPTPPKALPPAPPTGGAEPPPEEPPEEEPAAPPTPPGAGLPRKKPTKPEAINSAYNAERPPTRTVGGMVGGGTIPRTGGSLWPIRTSLRRRIKPLAHERSSIKKPTPGEPLYKSFVS